MSTISAYEIISPLTGQKDKCSKITTDAKFASYIFNGTTVKESLYTFSMWIKSETDSSIRFHDKNVTTTENWQRVEHTFVSNSDDFRIVFNDENIYYIYNAQLEEGNKATSYVPSPNDISVENIYVPGTVMVDGGKLYAESVTAGAIATDAIQARHIASNSVSTDKLTVGSGGNLMTVFDTFENATTDMITQPSKGSASIIESDDAVFGTKVARIAFANTNGHAHLFKANDNTGFVRVVQNALYKISFYAKASTACSVQFEVYGKNAKDDDTTNITSRIVFIKTEWTRFEYNITPNYDLIGIGFFNSFPTVKTFYIDAIQVERIFNENQSASEFRPGGTTLIDGGNIIAQSIMGDSIFGKTITADKMNITNGLSSMSADLGEITAGQIHSSNYEEFTEEDENKTFTKSGTVFNVSTGEIKSTDFSIGRDGGSKFTGIVEGAEIRGGKITQIDESDDGIIFNKVIIEDGTLSHSTIGGDEILISEGYVHGDGFEDNNYVNARYGRGELVFSLDKYGIDDYYRTNVTSHKIQMVAHEEDDTFGSIRNEMVNIDGINGVISCISVKTLLGGNGSASDERLKNTVEDIDGKYEELFDRLRPVSFIFNGRNRKHTGFIAQEVKESVEDLEIGTENFAAYVENEPNRVAQKLEFGDVYCNDYQASLRYEEFIAINTHMIQKTRKELRETQELLSQALERIASLENKLS